MAQQQTYIGKVDEAILIALSRYDYITASHVSRLLYPTMADENREAQRRLKKLADADYLLRLRALPTPRYGQAAHVFTLARKGRQYLTGLGIAVRSYFRPSEETRAAANNPFMAHRLATIDVLVAADCLCRDYAVVCPQLLTERELKQRAIRVDLPAVPSVATQATRRLAVIPDAWFQLSVAGAPPVSIAVELDRATENQTAWRRKVAALAVWAEGPYRDAFQTDNLTVAVVTPHTARRDTLASWTLQELTVRGLTDLADIFLFTAASPVTTAPLSFFCDPHWVVPYESDPVVLLDQPPHAASLEVPIYAT